MTIRSVRIVYLKELTDLLRDKRTIISMVVVPILLMPTIMITMGTLTSKLVGQARREAPKIMVMGGVDSPATLTALTNLASVDFVPVKDNYTNLISEKKIRAAVEIPSGFDADIEAEKNPKVRIYMYESEMKSTFATETVEKFFNDRRDMIVSNRLAAAHLPKSVLTPFEVRRTNVAPPQKVSGNLVGMILPYLVIIMCLTGSIYPAVDLTAGEKERGTMETLLTSPVDRSHLVLGKCLVVMTGSITTAVVSLLSNGVALVIMRATVAGNKSALPLTMNPTSLAVVGVVMIPLAIFFAALMVAIGLYSRSSKEANSYMQPLIILTILPAIAAALPGVELNSRLAMIPVLNISLLSRDLLTGIYHWDYFAIVFGSMCCYAAAALAVAVAAFRRETILFRT